MRLNAMTNLESFGVALGVAGLSISSIILLFNGWFGWVSALLWSLATLGMIGNFFMMMVTGVHGGGTRGEMIAGGIISFAINTAVYYRLLRFYVFSRKAKG